MEVNYLVVVVAAVVAFVIGGAWYSPMLFQKRWMHLLGAKFGDKSSFSPMQAMAVEFVTSLVTAYVLANFVSMLNITTLSGALQLGFWSWVGFQVPIFLGIVVFERGHFQLFLINAGFRLVGLLAMSAVLGLWH